MVKLTRTMNKCHSNTELSSHEETRCQFNGGRCAIKLGIDVHQDFYVVVEQVGGSNPTPPQRFRKEAFLHWAAKLKREGGEVHAVYELERESADLFLAWRLVRFQPDYHPVRKWQQILAKDALATGAARKKAIVAVARQLAVDLWRIKTGRLRAEELGLIE